MLFSLTCNERVSAPTKLDVRYCRVLPEGVEFTLSAPRKRGSTDQLPKAFFAGEQGWRSGWAFVSHAGLPPMWPGFDSRTRRHMWVEFVVGSRPCSERFFSGYSGFPLSSKTNISKFQLTLKSPERDEPIKYVFIYLFICSIPFQLQTLPSWDITFVF